MKRLIASAFLLFVIGTSLDISKLPAQVILFFWATTTLMGIASRIVLRWVLTAVRKSGFNCRQVVFVEPASNGSQKPAVMKIEVRAVAEQFDAVISGLAQGLQQVHVNVLLPVELRRDAEFHRVRIAKAESPHCLL